MILVEDKSFDIVKA